MEGSRSAGVFRPREEEREQGAALHGNRKVACGAGVASALRAGPLLAREAPHRKFRGPRRAAESSLTVGGQSERPDVMQRQSVLVEYGERWNRAALPDALGWRGYSAWC